MMGGYIILNDHKQPTHPFKNGGKSWEEVKNCPNIAMIVPSPFVVLDFDTVTDSQIMMKIIEGENLKCKVMKTDRGVHCWFRSTKQLKNYVKNRLAIGIYSDRKVCNRNAYVKIRGNGVDREWLQEFEEAEVDYLPKWLTPIKDTAEHFKFKGMGEGGGRNQELFNYILYLKSKGFANLEIDDTIRIINKYVFAEPLPEDEINTILRPEAFEKEETEEASAEEGKSNEGKFKFQHHAFARTLMNEMEIVCSNQDLYIYKDGYYQRNENDIESKMVSLFPAIKTSQRTEVLNYLKIIADKTSKIRRMKKDPYEVNLKNGKVNLLTGELKEHSPMDYDFYQVPVDYDPTAESKFLHKTLDDIFCNDQSVKDLFFEIVGDCLLPKNVHQKAFIFFGGGSNGKSTLFSLLENFIGQENVSTIELDKLAKTFTTAELEHKLVNIGDDLNLKSISSDNGTIKKLISGEPVQVERKYHDPYSFKSYATQIFATNELPYSFDKSYGMMRRLCFIPCLANFGKGGVKKDPRIKEKLTNPIVLSALLNEAIAGLKRLIENGDFTEPTVVSEAKEQYRMESSSVLNWVDEMGIELDKILSTSAGNLYAEYVLWTKTYSDKAVGKKTFNNELRWKFNLAEELVVRKHDGKATRFFVTKIEE